GARHDRRPDAASPQPSPTCARPRARTAISPGRLTTTSQAPSTFDRFERPDVGRVLLDGVVRQELWLWGTEGESVPDASALPCDVVVVHWPLERSSGRVEDRTTPRVGHRFGGKWWCRSARDWEGDSYADRGDRAPAYRLVECEINTRGKRCRGWQSCVRDCRWSSDRADAPRQVRSCSR